MIKDKVNIYDYKDYREYLLQVFRERKRLRDKYSYKKWSTELGLSSVSGLTMIIKAQRHPGKSIKEKLIADLNLEEKEIEYFETMIEVAKSAKSDSSMIVLMMNNQTENEVSDENRPYQFRWQMGFLREATKWKDFKDKKTWIESKSRFKIDLINFEDVLSQMKNDQMLIYSNDKLVVNKNYKYTPPKENYFPLLHKDFLKMAEISYETKLSQRLLEYRMIVIKDENIEKANKRLKELINEFIREFDESESSSKESKIYLTNIHLLPISK